MKKIVKFSLISIIIGLECCPLSSEPQIPYPDLTVSQLNLAVGNQVYESPTGIVSPKTTPFPTPFFTLHDYANIIFKAGTQITLNPGFHASGFNSYGQFHGYIEKPDFEVVLFEPTDNPGFVGQYEKLEIGIKPPLNIYDPSPSGTDPIHNFFNTYQDGTPKNNFDESVGINPYNPDDINVYATFHSPSGKITSWNGFFYRDYTRTNDPDPTLAWIENQTNYPFRIRFAPDEIGIWTFDVTIETPSVGNYTVNSFQFFCQISDNPGYLEIGNSKRFLRFSKVPKQNFFGIGENLANSELDFKGIHPNLYPTQEGWMNELSSVNGNLFSLSLCSADWGIEWENIGVYDKYPPHYDYPSGNNELFYHLGGNRQINAWEIDNVFKKAKDLNLYMKFWVLPHWGFESGGGDYFPPCAYWPNNPEGPNNPYNLPGMQKPKEFFTNSLAITYFKKELRYIIARWGYSTNIAWYDLANEIDKWYGSELESVVDYPNLNNWFSTMGHFIREELKDKHLISGSYAGQLLEHRDRLIFGNQYVDIAQLHDYSRKRQVNMNRSYSTWKFYLSYDKPIIFGEVGELWNPDNDYHGTNGLPYICTLKQIPLQPDEYKNQWDGYSSFHNAIWASSFMGTLGCGLYWDWFWVTHNPDFPQFSNFKPLAQFFKMFTDNNDFENHNFIPGVWKSKNTENNWRDNSRLENYWLINTGLDYGLGWVHNSTSYWYDLLINQDCKTFQERPEDDDDTYSEPYYREKDHWDITCLKLGKWYTADLYHAPNYTGDLVHDGGRSKRCNIAGIVKFSSDGMFSTSPDFGYKLYQGKKKSSDSLAAEIVDCPMDTITTTGIYENDTVGILHYFWDFGNGTNSNIWHPQIYYSTPGIYTITLIVTDSVNLFDTIRQSFIVPDSCFDSTWKKRAQNLNVMTGFDKMLISVYPNPSDGIFDVLLDARFPVNDGSLELFSSTGSIVYTIRITEKKNYRIDIRKLSDGLYFLTVRSQGHVFLKKLVKFGK